MIADAERLLRRIHPDLISDGRPNSSAFRFKERTLSVDREGLVELEALRRSHPGRQFARLGAGACRAAGCDVIEDPLPDNPAHANVVAPPDLSNRASEQLSRQLRAVAEFPV